MPMPPLERYIHILPEYVVKKRLQEHEKGYRGYLPDFTTLKKRDDNELLALELIKEHLPNLSVRVPELVYEGKELAPFLPSSFITFYRSSSGGGGGGGGVVWCGPLSGNHITFPSRFPFSTYGVN